MTSLIPLNFEGHHLRMVMKDETPWWVAADVCSVLNIASPRHAVRRLEDYEKGVISNTTLGGEQNQVAVNESGVYSLVLGSRKKEAKAFKRWLTCEVIPSIRETGRYETPGYKQSAEAEEHAMELYRKTREFYLSAGYDKLQSTARGMKAAEDYVGGPFYCSADIQRLAREAIGSAITPTVTHSLSDQKNSRLPTDRSGLVEKTFLHYKDIESGTATMQEIFETMGIPEAQRNRALAMAVGKGMRLAGWFKQRLRVQGQRPYAYTR